MGKTRKPVSRLWASLSLLVLLVAAWLAFDFFVLYPRRPQGTPGATVTVDVPRGMGPKGLSTRLFQTGLVDRPLKFALWLRASGSFQTVKSGRFDLREGLSPRALVERLSGRDDNQGVRLTVPEGFTLSRLAARIQDRKLGAVTDVLAAATSRALLQELGIPGPTAEGYLFPDTYYFDPGVTPREILSAMHDNFETKTAFLKNRPPAERRALVILASIVQAEARFEDEMPTIAGVYTNRLNPRKFPVGLLQADPTVAYGCEPVVTPKAPSCRRFDGRLRRAQLADPKNPYNTYAHKGLPPGPICLPGLKALKAASSPAKVPYFFFVADKKGRHHFSVTLKEHNRAVNTYLR